MNENRSAMQLQSSMAPGQVGDDEDDDDDEDYWDDDGFEGTPLEEYSTPLDYDNGEDAYHFFTSALLRELIFLSSAPDGSSTRFPPIMMSWTKSCPGITGVQNSDAAWYQRLTAALSDDQKKQLQEIYSISQQRRSTAGKGHW